MIAFPCPQCQATLRAPEEKAGAQSKCPRCGCAVEVPPSHDAEAEEVLEVVAVEDGPAPANGERREWHCARKKEHLGPFSESDVKRAICAGSLRPDDKVWRHGMMGWEPASKHFAFPDALASAPRPNVRPDDVVHPLVRTPSPRASATPRPPKPPLDPSGRYYLCDCLGCKRQLRVPREKRGCISQCPTCRLFFRVWGRPRRGVAVGLPVTLRVSAHLLQWPTVCACCLGEHDDFLKAKHFGRANLNQGGAVAVLAVWAFKGKSAAEDLIPHDMWKIPYCWDCLKHVESRRDEHMCDACSALRPAVEYHGYQGSVHAFSFYNWQYANRFIVLNYDKCLM